jgi:uncharacterized protein (TIRG00374 family)
MARLRYAFLLLGLCVFAVLVHQVGPAVIVQNVRAMGWWFLAIIAVWMAAYTLNTCTFALILGHDRRRVGLRRLYGTVVSGFAMNYATPFLHMGGEPFRIAVLRKSVGGARAAFATLSFKLLNAASSLCYWTMGALVVAFSGRLPKGLSALVVAVPLVVFVAAALFVRRHSNNVFVSVRRLTARYRLLAPLDRVLARREKSLEEVDAHLRGLWRARPGTLWAALVTETTARIIIAQELRIVLYALGKPVGFWPALAVDSVANIMITALFFIPFEAGAREGGLFLLLSKFGMPSAVSIVVPVVSRIRELFWIGIGMTWGHFLAAAPRQASATSTAD